MSSNNKRSWGGVFATALIIDALGGCRGNSFTESVKAESTDSASAFQMPLQVTAGNESNFAPDLTPTGSYVFYTSDRNGNKEIWLKRTIGGFGKQVTRHPADDFAPVLSPNGKRLAFISRRHDAAGDLEVIDLGFSFREILGQGEGSVDHVNLPQSEDTNPSWFPDGKKLVFSARKTGQKIPTLMIVDLKELTALPLADLTGDQPSVSRDGRMITFVKNGALYLHLLANKTTTKLTEGGVVQDGQPQFSPDNKSIVFIRYADDTNRDGKLNGDDRPTIWTADIASQSAMNGKENYSIRPLTAAAFGAYSPQLRGPFLFFALQTNEGLNIFRLPASGQAKAGSDLATVNAQVARRDDYYEKTYLLRRAAADFYATQQLDAAAECALMELEWVARHGRRREAEWTFAKIKANFKDKSEIVALASLAMIGLELEPIGYPQYVAQLDDEQKQLIGILLESVQLQIAQSGEKSSRVRAKGLLLKAKLQAAQREFFAANQTLAALVASADKEKDKENGYSLAAEAALYAAVITPATSDIDTAIRALREVAAKYSQNRDVALRAAQVATALAEGRPNRMEALLKLRTDAKGVPLVPAVAHFRIAEIFLAEGKKTVAANELRQIVAAYPESPEIQLQAASRLVVLEQEAQRFEAAQMMLAQLQQSMAGKSSDQKTKAQRLMIDFLLNRGEGLLKLQESGMALKEYAKVLALEPLNIPAHRGRIDASFMRHELGQVKSEYEKLAKEHPTVAEWTYIFGYAQTYDVDQAESLRQRLRSINTAIKTIEVARQINSQSLYIHQTLGWLYIQKNFFVRQYQRSGIMGSLNYRLDLVGDFLGIGDPDWRELALESYQNAYYLSRPASLERASLDQNLGVVYYAMSNFQKSLFYYLQRIKLLPVIPMRDSRAESIVFERAGRAAFQIEELELAENLQRQALTAWERVGNDQRIAYSLDALALTLRERDKFPEAKEIYLRLLRTEQRLGQDVNAIGTLSNLGYCSFMNKEQNQALEYFAEADAKLTALENADGKVTNGNGQADAIKVDLGGGGSSSKGFDLFSRRLLLLTFRAKIYEKLDRPDLALATYQIKLDLLRQAQGDKLSRAEEISILENNIGDLQLKIGLHGKARESFTNAESTAKKRRAKDQKDPSPAEVTNRLNRSRIELRLASLGVLPVADLVDEEKSLDAMAEQMRVIYQGGARVQAKVFAQTLAIAGSLKASSSSAPKDIARSQVEESLLVMHEAKLPEAATSGPLLTLDYLGLNKAAAATTQTLLSGFRERAIKTPNLEWKIHYSAGYFDLSFEALERHLKGGGSLATPADRALARTLFEQLIASAYSSNNMQKSSALMQRYALLHVTDLSRRLGLVDAQITKLLSRHETAKIRANLGDADAVIMLHRHRANDVYAWIMTKEQEEVIQFSLPAMPARQSLRAESFAPVFINKALVAALAHKGGNIYLVPDDELYDVDWESVKWRGETLAAAKTITFIPSPDLLPVVSSGRRLTKASLGYVAIQSPSAATLDAVKIGNEGRLFDQVTLDAAGPISEKFSAFDLLHIELPLLLNDVEPASSTIVGGGQEALAYRNDINLRSLAQIHLPTTAGIILNDVQRINTDLQASGAVGAGGKVYDGWAAITLAALATGTPTVLLVNEQKTVDWKKFYKALGTMSMAEAKTDARVSGRILGYPGIPAQDEVSFAKSHLEGSSEEAEDAAADRDFETAAFAYKRALYYAQRLNDQKSEDILRKKLVGVLFQKRDFDAALRYQLIIAAKIKPHPGAAGTKTNDVDLDPVDYANAAVDAAVLAVRANHFAQASKLFDEAEAIFTEDGMTDQLGKIWQYRGINFENQKKYEDTIAAYTKAEGFYRQRKPEEAANQLLNIGNVYNRYLSSYQKALEYYNQAAISFQKMGRPDLYVPVLIDAANARMVIGELEGAIDSLEQHVIPKIDPSKQRLLWVRATQMLANAYYRAGLFQKAQDLNQQTLAQADKIDNKTSGVNARIDVIGLRAMIEAKLGQFKQAFADFHEAITIAESYGLKSQIALLYNNYGFWARDYGAVDESIKFFNTALRIDEELKSRSAVAFDNRNLGLSLILKGDYNGATQLLKQALIESEALNQVYNAAYCNFGLADIAMRQSQWRDGEELFKKALAISEKGYMRDMVWRAYAGLAAAQRNMNDLADAKLAYEKSVQVIESMRAGLQSDESRSGFFSDAGVQNVYSDYSALLMHLGEVESAWNISERSRSRAFIDALGSQKMRLAGMNRLNKAQDSEFDKVSAIGALDLAELVGLDTAVIEYHVTKDQLLIWVLKDGRISGKVVPISSKDLGDRVRDFRELMENYSSPDYLGQELADVLIAPVSKELSGAKRLAIVPHGSLHFVPFAALPVSKHALMIDQFPLFYLDSATMAKFTLVGHGKPFTRDTQITAIANPHVDGSMLADLPFAEKEGGVIGRYFPQRKLYVGRDATKARAFDAAPTADILHLAVHGEFRPAAPSESRLLLAPTATKEGSLTVADMFTLPLNANMVTLSACDTGLGRISRADDVVGMDRALFYAGAKTVVSSLWRINDVASAVVMKRFYRYLSEGSDKAESMRKAQLVVRKYFQHPAYWSSFRVIGQYQ